MFRQQFAGLLHAVQDARCEFGFAEVAAHGGRQLPPENFPAFRMDGLGADDGKLVRARRHENQHAIPVGRLVHAEAEKFFLRGGHGVVGVLGTDDDADLAGGLVFGVVDGRDDAVVLQVLGKMFRVHKLPAPSRAAAAKAAAAAGKSSATAESAPAGEAAKTAAAGKPAAIGTAAPLWFSGLAKIVCMTTI